MMVQQTVTTISNSETPFRTKGSFGFPSDNRIQILNIYTKRLHLLTNGTTSSSLYSRPPALPGALSVLSTSPTSRSTGWAVEQRIAMVTSAPTYHLSHGDPHVLRPAPIGKNHTTILSKQRCELFANLLK